MTASFLFGPPDVPVTRISRKNLSEDVAIDLPAHARLHTVITFSLRRVFFACALIVLGIFIVRTGNLQVQQGAMWRAYAEDNRLQIETTRASRGVLLDRTGASIADNEATMMLVVDVEQSPQDASMRRDVLSILAHEGIIVDEFTGKTFVDQTNLSAVLRLASELSPAAAAWVIAHYDKYPWMSVVRDERRTVRGGDSFAHVVGYMGKIDEEEWKKLKGTPGRYGSDEVTGKTGIEKHYERELRGVPGRRQIEVNAYGHGNAVIVEEIPQHGEALTLTLAAPLQEVAASALAHAVATAGGSGGALVVLDPQSGGILALVSAPAFNIDQFAQGDPAYVNDLLSDPRRPLFNRAVSGQYPIGSTIKPMIAVAALQEGVATVHTQLLSQGGIRVGDWFFPDWKAGGHGWVNVYGAIAESVNTFFYIIGGGFEEFRGLGIERMARYARAFGLGARTGIDVPGERAGFVPSPEWKEQTKGEQWYVGDTYHFAIGQGDVLATPLQVARMTAAFANGGYLITPRVVQSRLEKTRVHVEGVDAETIDIVKQAMRQTVTEGSARALSSLPLTVAGKTGTAQGGSDTPPHAWFTGFAPFDQPEIVVTVLIEHGGEGSMAAVPVAREVFTWWYAHGATASR